MLHDQGMDQAWQVCIRPETGRDKRKLCISLNRRGDLAINAPAWESMNRWFAVLYFDREGNRIGLKPVRPGEENSFPMRRIQDRDAVVIHASRFMRQFEIRIEETIRFVNPYEGPNGIWILDLNTAIVTDKVRKHWRRKK